MSHQSPYAMHPRPSRVPQHAAALGGNAVLRERVRRAMKLLLIAIVWATGLFVVIAAVTMVAVATAPIARNTSATLPKKAPGGGAAIPAARAGRTARGRPAPTRAAVAAGTLEVYAGQGSADTSQFAIGGTGSWELAWSYDCAAAGSAGSFIVSEHGSGGAGGAQVARRGTAGHGTTWAHHDAGRHYLAIRTRCRWRLTVTSRR